VEIGAEKNIGT